MNEFGFRTQDLVENPSTRLAVCLCLDVSPSMEGDPIEELNKGTALFFEALQKNELTKHSVEIAVVTFAGTAVARQNFGPVLQATAPSLNIEGGGTSLGEGVELSLDLLEERKKAYKLAGIEYFQPWLIIMTDGEPTDNSHLRVAPRAADLVQHKKLSVFPIGVGDDSDLETLQMFSPKRPPLRLKGLRFEEFFEFLGKSAERVSASNPGDTVPLDTEGISKWAEMET